MPRVPLVCVLGTSTSLTYWAFSVAALAMEEAYGGFCRVHCTTLAEFAPQWEARGGRAVLFTTDLLDDGLSEWILASGAPVIALVDCAELAILTAAKLRGLAAIPALRLSSRYICALDDVLAEPSTRVFAPRARLAPVGDFVRRLIEAMRLDDAPALAQRVLRRLAPGVGQTVGEAVRAANADDDPREPPAEWSSDERAAFRQVAADYQPILDRKPVEQISWPPALLHGAAEGYAATRPLPLLGPARLLIWGPYMHLPKGRWTAQMEFEVEDNLSSSVFVADVLVGGEFAAIGELRLPRRGVFAWRLEFEVKDAAKPVEARLTLARSAIEATLLLRGVRLSR